MNSRPVSAGCEQAAGTTLQLPALDRFINGPPGYNLLLHHDFQAGARTFESFVSINVYGTSTGDYALGSSDEGGADLVWLRPSGTCLADSGTVTLSAIGAIGETVTGSVDVESFSGADCPDSATGVFSMTIIDSETLVD